MIYYAKQKVKKIANIVALVPRNQNPKNKPIRMNNFNIPKIHKKGIQSFKIDHYRHQTNNTHLHRDKKKKIKNPLHHYYTEKKSQKFFLPSPRIPSEKNQISLAVTPQKHFWKKK